MWNHIEYFNWLSEDCPVKLDVFELNISNQNINSLGPINDLPNLYKICFSNDKIHSLEPLKDCKNLQIIECSNNKINSLDSLEQLKKLTYSPSKKN